MSTSQGLGRLKAPLFRDWAPWTNLFALNDDARTVAEEFHWGGYPPAAVEIPYSWLRPPVRIRQDNPINVAEVAQSGGDTARSRNLASPTDREWRFSETLHSVVTADPANLSQWVTTYYDEPRPRLAQLALLLNERAETEIWRILGVTQGRRISITGAPAGWPTGASELVVEGITHSITADARVVSWLTAPVIGEDVGEVGPWFRTDDSRTSDASGTDAVPF